MKKKTFLLSTFCLITLFCNATLKETLLTTLQNKDSSMQEFREATDKLGNILAYKASPFLDENKITIETPLTTTDGYETANDIILVAVVRSGIALIDSFRKNYPQAKVGFIGLERDEETSLPSCYYYKVPAVTENTKIIVLEPMLATGGSAKYTIEMLKNKNGAENSNIIVVSVIAAIQGVSMLEKTFPGIKVIAAKTDYELNEHNFIVPGLGDFGDRYWGTQVGTTGLVTEQE